MLPRAPRLLWGAMGGFMERYKTGRRGASFARDGGARVALVRESKGPAGVYLHTPGDAGRFFLGVLVDPLREEFAVAGLNVRHRLVEWTVVSIGCLTSSLVHPREVFTALLAMGGVAGFLCGHNHPSGDPEPSAEDVSLTRRLASAGTLMGIEMLDSVVVGTGTDRWVSLKDRGVL